MWILSEGAAGGGFRADFRIQISEFRIVSILELELELQYWWPWAEVEWESHWAQMGPGSLNSGRSYG